MVYLFNDFEMPLFVPSTQTEMNLNEALNEMKDYKDKIPMRKMIDKIQLQMYYTQNKNVESMTTII